MEGPLNEQLLGQQRPEATDAAGGASGSRPAVTVTVTVASSSSCPVGSRMVVVWLKLVLMLVKLLAVVVLLLLLMLLRLQVLLLLGLQLLHLAHGSFGQLGYDPDQGAVLVAQALVVVLEVLDLLQAEENQYY